MLGNKNRVSPGSSLHGRLPALVFRFRCGEPFPDKVCRMVPDYIRAFFTDIGKVRLLQLKTAPEL